MAKQLVGKALYIELRRDSEVSQIILTPQLKNPLKDSQLKPYIISRSLQRDTKRKPWRFTSAPRLSSADYEVSGLNSEQAITSVEKQIKVVSSFFTGYSYGGWEVFKTPIVIEMSVDDAMNVAQKQTPVALIRRVMKARKEAGFPDSVNVDLPIVPAPF
jgi:hypothetical protein